MKSILGLTLAATMVAFAGAASAQGAIGNGVPQPMAPKADKLSVEQCQARTPGDKKDPKEASQARYCKRLIKKAAKKPA